MVRCALAFEEPQCGLGRKVYELSNVLNNMEKIYFFGLETAWSHAGWGERESVLLLGVTPVH